MLKTMGLGLGGGFEPPRKRSSPRRNCFLNTSLFLLGVLAVKIPPMEKGLAAPLRRTRKFGSLGLCKGAGSTLLHIGLATWRFNNPHSTIINRKSQPRRRRLPLFMGIARILGFVVF